MPIVPVHDLTIHPRENDLVIATYGRALWVGDMQPLRELSAELLAQPVHMFEIKPATRYDFGTQGMNYALGGDKYLRIPNEPEGITVNLWLQTASPSPVRITVADSAGAVARQLTTDGKQGLNRTVIPFVAPGGRGRGGGGGGTPVGGGRSVAGNASTGVAIAPGRYTVTLDVAGTQISKPAVVRPRR